MQFNHELTQQIKERKVKDQVEKNDLKNTASVMLSGGPQDVDQLEYFKKMKK